MFFSRALLGLLVASSIQLSTSLYFKFQYGGKWVDVGNQDLNAAVYSAAYSNFNQVGGSYQIDGKGWISSVICTNYNDGTFPAPDVTFTVTGQAEYGQDTALGITGWNFRDLFIHTMWDGVQKLTNPTGWSVCSPKITSPGCTGMACANTCYPTNIDAPCTALTWGHNMPSILRINTYNDDGTLRPEFFEVQLTNIASSSTAGTDGCSTAVNELALAFGLVPGIGSTVKTVVQMVCEVQ